MGSRTARTRARSGHDRIAPAQKVPFRADYLFLFLLRDTASGAILFAGRFEEPSR